MALTSEQAKEYGKMGGRKGYELENEQLQRMRKIIDADLKVLEKIYRGKATEKDFKKLTITQARVGKYLDKLHASKSETDLKGNLVVSGCEVTIRK